MNLSPESIERLEHMINMRDAYTMSLRDVLDQWAKEVNERLCNWNCKNEKEICVIDENKCRNWEPKQ